MFDFVCKLIYNCASVLLRNIFVLIKNIAKQALLTNYDFQSSEFSKKFSN